MANPPSDDSPHRVDEATLATMITERDYADFPTAWALQADPRCPDHDPRCSAAQTDGAMLCDCDAVQELWCVLRQEMGLGVPADQVPTLRPWPPDHASQ